MFSAQTTTVEVIQTTRAMLHVGKRIACGKDDMGNMDEFTFVHSVNRLRRVGGIYLMYAVFFKQPTQMYVKIQVSPSTWEQLCRFIEFLPKESFMDDVRYTFWRLYQMDAFRFTALDYPVGLENLVDYDNINLGESRDKSIFSTMSLPLKETQDLTTIQSNIDSKLINLETEYNKLKAKLGKGQEGIKKSLPPSKIFHDINETLKTTINKLSSKNNEIKKECKLEYNSRREKKRKAATFIGNDSVEKNRSVKRDSDVDADADADANSEHHRDDSEKMLADRQLRRMSARSLFLERLPQSVLDELNESSKSADERENGSDE